MKSQTTKREAVERGTFAATYAATDAATDAAMYAATDAATNAATRALREADARPKGGRFFLTLSPIPVYKRKQEAT